MYQLDSIKNWKKLDTIALTLSLLVIVISLRDIVNISLKTVIQNFIPVLVVLILVFGLGIIGSKINPEETENWKEVPRFLWIPTALFFGSPLIFWVLFVLYIGSPFLVVVVAIVSVAWILLNLGYFVKYTSNNAYYIQLLLAIFFGVFYFLVFNEQFYRGIENVVTYWWITTFILFILSPLLFIYSLYIAKLLYFEAWKRISIMLLHFLVPYLLLIGLFFAY